MHSTLVRPVRRPDEITSQTPHPNHTPAPNRLALIDLAGVAGLSAVIAIHTSELSGKVEETAYLGLGYIALIMASIVSIVLLAQRDARGWVLGGLTTAATAIGFVLTRTTGLPGATGDIGNWGETIALWSLIAEGAVVVLSLIALTSVRRREVGHRSV